MTITYTENFKRGNSDYYTLNLPDPNTGKQGQENAYPGASMPLRKTWDKTWHKDDVNMRQKWEYTEWKIKKMRNRWERWWKQVNNAEMRENFTQRGDECEETKGKTWCRGYEKHEYENKRGRMALWNYN